MIECRCGIRLQRQPDGGWQANAKATAENETTAAVSAGAGAGVACAAAARAAVEALERRLLARGEAADPPASLRRVGAHREQDGSLSVPPRRRRQDAAPGARRLSEGFRE